MNGNIEKNIETEHGPKGIILITLVEFRRIWKPDLEARDKMYPPPQKKKEIGRIQHATKLAALHFDVISTTHTKHLYLYCCKSWRNEINCSII